MRWDACKESAFSSRQKNELLPGKRRPADNLKKICPCQVRRQEVPPIRRSFCCEKAIAQKIIEGKRGGVSEILQVDPPSCGTIPDKRGSRGRIAQGEDFSAVGEKVSAGGGDNLYQTPV
jgi:hypothetical protein